MVWAITGVTTDGTTLVGTIMATTTLGTTIGTLGAVHIQITTIMAVTIIHGTTTIGAGTVDGIMAFMATIK